MTLRPPDHALFIAPDRRDKTDRGLFLPTIAQDDACTGVVLAAGAGCWMKRLNGRLVPFAKADDKTSRPGVRRFQPAKVGDRVVFAPERAQQIPFGYGTDAPEHVLLDVRDVLALLPAEASA